MVSSTLHQRICMAELAPHADIVEGSIMDMMLSAHVVNADQTESIVNEGQTISLSTLSGISFDHPVTFVEFQPPGRAPVGVLFVFEPIPNDYEESFLAKIRDYYPELDENDILREAKVHVKAFFFVEETPEESAKIAAHVQFPLTSDGRFLEVIGIMGMTPTITSETRLQILYTCLSAISSQAN